MATALKAQRRCHWLQRMTLVFALSTFVWKPQIHSLWMKGLVRLYMKREKIQRNPILFCVRNVTMHQVDIPKRKISLQKKRQKAIVCWEGVAKKSSPIRVSWLAASRKKILHSINLGFRCCASGSSEAIKVKSFWTMNASKKR